MPTKKIVQNYIDSFTQTQPFGEPAAQPAQPNRLQLEELKAEIMQEILEGIEIKVNNSLQEDLKTSFR